MNEKFFIKIIDALVNQGYIVIENAMDKRLISSLSNYAQREERYQKAGISPGEELHLDRSKRRDKTLWVEEDGKAQSEYLQWSEQLRERLNRELYLGLSYYESHFALYEKGDFYEKHLDAFRGSKNRVVTTVLYLNEGWKKSDGGELIIYDIDGAEVNRVTPNAGTLVVFLSEKFPHEVLLAQTKRYSIAGWFRVDR